MSYKTLAPLAMLALAAGLGFRSPTKPVSFAELQSGERIEIDYYMSGCFHSEHLAFRFWRSNGLEVEAHRFVRDTKTGKEQRTFLGRTTLNKQDEAKLDRSLAFYRTKPAGGCTTVVSGKIAMSRGNQELSSENFRDDSCSVDRNRLGFGELSRRMMPKTGKPVSP